MFVMKTSDGGLRLLMAREGKENRAYPDPATGGAPWTIGVGHTGPEVHSGLYWTDEQIMSALRSDLKWVEDAINKRVSTRLSQNEFDALVSFVFNIGEPEFAKSTLLRLVNAGEYAAAAGQFDRWNIPAMIIPRRMGEKAQFTGAAFVPRLEA